MHRGSGLFVNAMQAKPQFIYPTSTQYPFDPVCSEIVSALEARNFDVPGIKITFSVYGSGEQWMRYVESITGDDFVIWFGRDQGKMEGGHWFNSAAVRRVGIPRRLVSVYSDESGPTLSLYVGGDWDADRADFMRGHGVNSKLDGKPRTYLQYRATCRCGGGYLGLGHSHPGQRSPLLVANNDLDREYDPEPGEPTEFKTDDVLADFDIYLQAVLATIKEHPEAVAIDMFPEPDPIPVPEWAAMLFCLGGNRDVSRIKQGRNDASELDAAHRYGMNGSGYRLCGYDVKNDGTVPELAYDGFLWCGTPWADGGLNPVPLIPGRMRSSFGDEHVIRIRPNRANGIYIADHGAYETRRREVMELAKDRPRFTNDEISDMQCARGRTIIPISEYKGGFSEPVVLINRELGFDEVEIVREGE